MIYNYNIAMSINACSGSWRDSFSLILVHEPLSYLMTYSTVQLSVVETVVNLPTVNPAIIFQWGVERIFLPLPPSP